MNAVVGFYRDEMDIEVDSAVNQRRDRMTLAHRSRRPEHRRSSAPASVNGIHRRRNKRWTWGSGRGSRMMNLRAMASGLALALASISGAALGNGVTIDYAAVGNPGNVALTSGTFGSRGSVANAFNIAKYETSNADYVKFLNTVDPSGTNPNSIYNAAMTSDTTNGGILNTGTVNGARYSVRSGFDLKPVTYVSWFSAARFANWLNNGQTSGTAGTETGAYTLNGVTSGTPVARNSGAQVYLPNLDEFTKAAYFDPTLSSGAGGYYSYATKSNSAPTAATSGVGTNLANYGGSNGPALTTGVVDGTALPNAASYYGLFNAYGNVIEYTDTIVGAGVANGGASWRLNTANAANWNSSAVRTINLVPSDSFGFRVAAVPEPGAIVLALAGLGGAFGGEYVRRRRKAKAC